MKGEVNDTLRDRVHAPCTLKSESVQGGVHAFARLHAPKDSPNLTKYKHTKRVRVQSKQGNTSPSPQNDQIGPEGGEGVHTPRKRVHACTLSMLTRERRTTERKDLEK